MYPSASLANHVLVKSSNDVVEKSLVLSLLGLQIPERLCASVLERMVAYMIVRANIVS
jgi:hypothetical protein